MTSFARQNRTNFPAEYCTCRRCAVVYKKPEECGSFITKGFKEEREPFFPHETLCEKCRLDLILFLFSKLNRARTYLAQYLDDDRKK